MNILHPILIHFPIALYISSFLLVVAEWIYVWATNDDSLDNASDFVVIPMLIVGSLFGVLAIPFGFYSAYTEYSGLVLDNVKTHAILGCVLPMIGALTSWAYIKSWESSFKLLLILVIITIICGHYGGALVHG